MQALYDLFSKELLKLSYDDRNDINEEIHGVQCLAVEESPELLRTSLFAFQSQLDSLPPTKKQIYNEIVRLKQEQIAQQRHWGVRLGPDGSSSRSFAEEDDFRLRFLRCELFNIPKAIQRFMNYLNMSYELFGRVALTRMVRINDFSKLEVRLMRKGCVQVLPYRDRAGRCVVVDLGISNDDETDLRDLAKIRFYIGDAVTRDSIESQRKGIVVIGDIASKMDRNVSFSTEVYRLFKKILEAVPSRLVALHSGWPDTTASRMFDDLSEISAIVTRLDCSTRIRLEIGNEAEIRHKLRGYGIPIHLFPVTKSGAIKVKYLNDWIRIRKMLEDASQGRYVGENNALSRVVICPGLTDVVFRQGTPSMKNPGNVIFRDTMINHLENHFNQGNHFDGNHQHPQQVESFCNWLIETTEVTKGGLFLEWDKQLNVWVKMIDRLKIKSKVTIAYRDITRRFLDHRQKSILNGETNGNRRLAVEEGEEKRNGFRRVSKRDRSDSNYNESSHFF